MRASSRIGQRYVVGDRVKKKTVGRSTLPPRVGSITGVEIRTDRRGHPNYYYLIQWDDLKSLATHAQHVLTPLNDTSISRKDC